MTRKEQILERGREIAASEGPLTAASVWDLGRLLRVAHSDAETDDEARVVDEAAAICSTLVVRDREALPVPSGDAIRRHLANPAGPLRQAADEIDRLGALTAVLQLTQPDGNEAREARATSAALALAVTHVRDTASLLPLAEAVSRRIADEGIVVSAEPLAVALTDVLGTQLGRALSGERFEAPAARAPFDAAEAASLASVFAKAFGKVSFAAPPELFDVMVPTARHEPSLVLHEVTPREAERTLVVFGGVEVTIGRSEIRVVMKDGKKESPILVCIERGEPGQVCASRGGATSRELVFALPSARRDLDGFALVMGDRIAFLRRL